MLRNDDVHRTDETRYQNRPPPTAMSSSVIADDDVLLQPTPRTSNNHHNRTDDMKASAIVGEKHRRGPYSSSLRRHPNTSDCGLVGSSPTLPPRGNDDDARRRKRDGRRDSERHDNERPHDHDGSSGNFDEVVVVADDTERRQSESSPARRNIKRGTDDNVEDEEVRDDADSSGGIVAITGTVRDVDRAITVLQKEHHHSRQQARRTINPDEYKRLREEKKQLQLLRDLGREKEMTEQQRQQYQNPASGDVLKRIQYSEEMMINQRRWQDEQLVLQDTIQQQSHEHEHEHHQFQQQYQQQQSTRRSKSQPRSDHDHRNNSHRTSSSSYNSQRLPYTHTNNDDVPSPPPPPLPTPKRRSRSHLNYDMLSSPKRRSKSSSSHKNHTYIDDDSGEKYLLPLTSGGGNGGLLSRATRKIKKHFSSSNGSGSKSKSSSKRQQEQDEWQEAWTTRTRLDPSPTRDVGQQRRRRRSRQLEQWNNGLPSKGHRHSKDDVSSIDTTSDGASTLTTNFTKNTHPSNPTTVSTSRPIHLRAERYLSTPPILEPNDDDEEDELDDNEGFVVNGGSYDHSDLTHHSSDMKEVASQTNNLGIKPLDNNCANNDEEVVIADDNDIVIELQRIKEKLSKQEEQVDGKVSIIEQELRKQEQELRDMGRRDERVKVKESNYISELASDLVAYKDECTSYRERIIQKEREIANIERSLLDERQKVLSLESENSQLKQLSLGSQQLSNDVDRVREKELIAYKEQCETYRQTVLEMTKKALHSDEEIVAADQMILALEEEKKLLISQLDQMQSLETMNASLLKKVEDGELKTSMLETEMATWKSRCSEATSDVATAKSKADEDRKLMTILESENASLIMKLNDSKNLVTIADRCSQLEKENVALRERNDNLIDKNNEMSKEVHESQVLASNTTRLQKIMSDNECYISKLQDDLSKARALHLESIQSTRQKYSDEIKTLNVSLTNEKEARLTVEKQIDELKDNLAAVERTNVELQSISSQHAKAQDNQTLKLMEHADLLRQENIACRDECISLKQELADLSQSNERTIHELRDKLTYVERVNVTLSDNLANANSELLLTRESNMKEVDDFIQTIKEKDSVLMKLKSDRSDEVDKLNGIIKQLECGQNIALSSNDELYTRLEKVKQESLCMLNDVKIEKTALLSDVQQIILDEQVALTKHMKEMVCNFVRRVESQKLEQAMNHSVAMSAIHQKQRDCECLLQTEKEKSIALEKSLETIKCDNQSLVDTFDRLCVKLSASNNNCLFETIDDMVLERSNTRILIRTLELDMKSLSSNIAQLEYEKDELSSQLDGKESELRAIELELEKSRDALQLQILECSSLVMKLEIMRKESDAVQAQMRKAFDEDRINQDNTVADIIAEKESALADVQDLKSKFNALWDDFGVKDSQLLKLQEKMNESLLERDEIRSRYEDCRTQVASLLDQSLNSKDHATGLMSHYMEIEDDLRRQLQLLQSERDGLERKLGIVQRESDRLMGDFYKEKHELTSNLTSKDDAVLVLEEEIENLTARKDEIQEQMDGLYGVIDHLKQSNVELNAHYNNVCNERDHLRSTIEELKGKMAKLEYFTDNEIQMAELSVEAEKLVHENAVEDLKSEFNLELKRQQIQAKELKNEVKQLERTNSEQGLMISRLKTAVRESLEEALRLGSKLTSEQAKLLELTNTVYSFEEENFKLKESLSQVQYDGLEIVELEQLQIIMSEKQTLQKELFDKETILVRTMNTLTHFQLKLAKAEQERDDQSEVAGAEIKRLQTELLSLEKHQHEKVQDLTNRLAQVEQERKLQSEAANIEMTRLKDDLSSLMSHSEAADAEVRRLKIHLSSLTDRERYEGVLMQLVRAEQEQIEQSECAKAEIKRLQTELSSLKMFQQEREQDIMTRQAQTEQEQALQLETANAEIIYLKGELSSSTKLHNEKEQSFMELARVEQSDISNAVIQQLKKRSEIAGAEINRLQTELSSLKMSQQEKEQELMTRLVQTEQEREMQMETADAEITRLKNDLTSLMDQFAACNVNENNHLYEELLSKLETNEGYYESRVRSLTMTIASLEEEIKSLTDENDRLSHINIDMLEERNQELNAKQQLLSDSSTIKSTGSSSKADYLNRTASEVETTIAAIKVHHSNTVRKLQSDLDDARARLKKYQRKVKDLTLLVNEGSAVVESLHNRLRLEKSRKDRNFTTASQDSSPLVPSRDNAAAWSAALARDSSEEESCPTTSSVESSDGMTTDSLVSADQYSQLRRLPRGAAGRESVLPCHKILSKDSEGGESLVSD